MIIKYIPLQQGLRQIAFVLLPDSCHIIKYIPLQQGLRPYFLFLFCVLLLLLSIFHYNKD